GWHAEGNASRTLTEHHRLTSSTFRRSATRAALGRTSDGSSVLSKSNFPETAEGLLAPPSPSRARWRQNVKPRLLRCAEQPQSAVATSSHHQWAAHRMGKAYPAVVARKPQRRQFVALG